MSPYLMIQPSPDFYGHVVEYGPLLMLWGCDPDAPKIPCGYQKQANRGKCNRWKCCWRDDGCFRSGCNLKMRVTSSKRHFANASLREIVISPMRQFETMVTSFKPPKMRHFAYFSIRQKKRHLVEKASLFQK